MQGEQRIGDDRDPRAQAGQQGEHADRQPAPGRRRLLDDERRRDPDDQHLEAHGEEPQEGEVGQRRRVRAGEAHERETGHAARDQSAPPEPIGQVGQREGAHGANRQHGAEVGERGGARVELPGDRRKRDDQDRALEAGEHHGKPGPDEGDPLPPVELDH